MEYLRESFFIGLLSRFLDFATEIFRGSVTYRLCMWCWAALQNGVFYRFAVGGEKLAALWRESLAYRALAGLLALPDRLSRRILGGDNVLTQSFLVSCALDFAENGLVFCIGGAVFAMLIIPQERWNNLYSFAAAIILLLLFFLAAGRGRVRMSAAEIGFFPVLMLLCVVLSYCLSLAPQLSLRFLVFGVTCALFVLLTVNAPQSARDIHVLVALCSVGLAVCSLYALLQRAQGVEADSLLTDLTVNEDMPGRVFSFFENPNSFANVLVLFAPLMLTMALYAPGGRRKIWYSGVFLVSCAALLMTYSRGGWLSLVVALGVMLLCLGPRWVPLCIAALVLLAPFLPANILNRLLTIFNTGDSSIYTRAYIYSAMAGLIALYPVFGVGLGAAAVRHGIAVTGVYRATATFGHGHNTFLQIWAEMGIFGLIAFIGSAAVAVRGGLQLRRAEDPILRAAGVGSACGLCASLFFGITDYAWSYPRVMVLFWFVFALGHACRRLQKAG